MVDRQQISTVARPRIPDWLGDRLLLVGVALDEGGVEQLNQRNVKSVEPEHRFLALISMIMPGHGGRDDEVTWWHVGALAINGGEGTFSLDDEAQCRLGMSVSGRYFVRHDELDTSIESCGDFGTSAQSRILEN